MYLQDTGLDRTLETMTAAAAAKPGSTPPGKATMRTATHKTSVAVNGKAVSSGAAKSAAMKSLRSTLAKPLPPKAKPLANAPTTNVPPANLADVYGRFVDVLGSAVDYDAASEQPLAVNVGSPINLSHIPGATQVATMTSAPPSGAAPTSPPVSIVSQVAAASPAGLAGLGDDAPAPQGNPAPAASPPWLMPAAIGAGVLALMMLGKKRRRG